MRRRFACAALVLGSLWSVAGERPAAACSCAGTPQLAVEFTGEAIASTSQSALGRTWSFRATGEGLAVKVGEVVVVDVSGDDPPDPSGVHSNSSCSLGPYPAPGGTYAVGAYQGSAPTGAAMFFANRCGGYVRELAAPPPAERALPGPPTDDAEQTMPLPPLVGAAVALLGVGVLAGRRVRRSGQARP